MISVTYVEPAETFLTQQQRTTTATVETPPNQTPETPSPQARFLSIPWAAFPSVFIDDCAAGKVPTAG